jgi:hypothetical protein
MLSREPLRWWMVPLLLLPSSVGACGDDDDATVAQTAGSAGSGGAAAGTGATGGSLSAAGTSGNTAGSAMIGGSAAGGAAAGGTATAGTTAGGATVGGTAAGGATVGGTAAGGATGGSDSSAVGGAGGANADLCSDCDNTTSYCQVTVGGPPGSMPHASCQSLPQGCGDTPTCACLSKVTCGAQCTGNAQQGLRVTCLAP